LPRILAGRADVSMATRAAHARASNRDRLEIDGAPAHDGAVKFGRGQDATVSTEGATCRTTAARGKTSLRHSGNDATRAGRRARLSKSSFIRVGRSRLRLSLPDPRRLHHHNPDVGRGFAPGSTETF